MKGYLKARYDKNDLSQKDTTNRRNGYSSKTIKSELGPVKIHIPRDRDGQFEPKIVPKYQVYYFQI
ncbi:MAG: hypothetical protein TIS_03577 [Tissierella sp.]